MAEREVQLAVSASLEADFGKHQSLLPGREISRRPSSDGTQILIAWAMPDAPLNATVMSPWFTLNGDRIELGGIDYYDADGKATP